MWVGFRGDGLRFCGAANLLILNFGYNGDDETGLLPPPATEGRLPIPNHATTSVTYTTKTPAFKQDR